MALSQSMEDYLEAIFEIDRKKKVVRVKDVSEKLGVTMPSVNGALKNLEAKGMIKHEKYEFIELTDAGLDQASQIASRHRVLRSLLTDVFDVDPDTAEEEACRIEHVLSADTIRKIKRFMTQTASGDRKKD